jgi:uncharacterized protein
MKYGLPDTAIEKINAVFASFAAVERVVLYGSRAKGNYKPGSDIDLTMYGQALLLPYMIDLSVFADLKHPELEAHIGRVGVVFYERNDGASC